MTDLDIYVENFKFARRLAATEPFKSGTVREAEPEGGVALRHEPGPPDDLEQRRA